MTTKLPSKDFAPAGVPANIFNLVRALEQFTLQEKISFYVKTSEEMQQCAAYFFERAVINSDSRKFAAVALKMLKFYPNEDVEKLTFKNALLGELKIKCYDAIFESNITTERAVGIVKFFGELYNVGLIINGILKKQFDALNQRKLSCAKSRKCLLCLTETVKESVRKMLETDQSTVVKKTLEIIEEVEGNPTMFQDTPEHVSKKLKERVVKTIVHQPKTFEEKQEVFRKVICEITAENSTEIIKKIKDNHTYLLNDDIWRLFYKEMLIKALDSPSCAVSVIEICLKTLNGTTIKKEDCRKLFYDILKTSISNALIDKEESQLDGFIMFIDKMIDRKIVSISNIRELIELILTFQGDNVNLASKYFIKLFEVIKSSKKIKQSKIQELNEPIRNSVIEIVKGSTSDCHDVSLLEKYLFGEIPATESSTTPHVPKAIPSASKAENTETTNSTAKKVRNKKKTFVDFNGFDDRASCSNENGFSNAFHDSSPPETLSNAIENSYDDITKLFDELKLIPDANDNEVWETETAITKSSVNTKKSAESDNYEEFLRREFPDLAQPSTLKANHAQSSLIDKTALIDFKPEKIFTAKALEPKHFSTDKAQPTTTHQLQSSTSKAPHSPFKLLTDKPLPEAFISPSSSSFDETNKLIDDFFKNVNKDTENSFSTEDSYVTATSNCLTSVFDSFNGDSSLFESSQENLSYATEASSKFMDIFCKKPPKAPSPVQNGLSSSSSVRGSPDSLSSADEYIVPSFNFSGLIDNLVKTENANIKELVDKASTRSEWDWKKFAEELLSKSLKTKDLDTYIDIGMLIVKDSQQFKKTLGDVALSALGNELGKEIGIDFIVENESDDTATLTANFISLLYKNGCLNDFHLYQCLSHVATGSFGNIRRVKIFIALLRPATTKVKKNLEKEVMIDYLQTVRLRAIEPMKSSNQWVYSELTDLLISITATNDVGSDFIERPKTKDNRTFNNSINQRQLILTRENAPPPIVYPGPVRYLNHQERFRPFFDPRSFPVNNMMRIQFNSGPPFFIFDSKDNR